MVSVIHKKKNTRIQSRKRQGGLFNLEKTMVSVLHKKKNTRIQSRNAQVQEVGGHAAKDQKQIRTSSW